MTQSACECSEEDEPESVWVADRMPRVTVGLRSQNHNTPRNAGMSMLAKQISRTRIIQPLRLNLNQLPSVAASPAYTTVSVATCAVVCEISRERRCIVSDALRRRRRLPSTKV